MKKILNNQLAMKFAFVLFLLVLLQIPVSMVSGLISERSYRQDDMRDEIARSSSGEQRIVGPFIVVDYTDTELRDGKASVVDYRKSILPKDFDMSANLDSFEKYRGIYRARLFQAQTNLKGQFDLSELDKLDPDSLKALNLVVGVKDSRGLIKLDKMRVSREDAEILPGTGVYFLSQGFRSELKLADIDTSQPLTFDLNFLLQGMEQLEVTPIGEATAVKLSSSWPHPSFIGDYLPISSQISAEGFSAQWSSNKFSSNVKQLFDNCFLTKRRCNEFDQRQMGVALIDPVDHYLKSHRAVNYSLLVLTLVFAAFFLLELFQARPIHPVQYGFVGLALALFYLLLISMSEHIGFNLAYLTAALASTSLLGFYVGGILNHVKHGIAFGTAMLVLYSMLFGLLQAESYALLFGSLLCFALLSFVMVLTRKVDWYQRSHTMNGDSSKASGEDV